MRSQKRQQINEALLNYPNDTDRERSSAPEFGGFRLRFSNQNAQPSGSNNPKGRTTVSFEGGNEEFESVEVLQESFMERYSQALEDLEQNEKYMIITEPQGFFGQLRACFQNMFEVLLVLTVISFARLYSSYVSLAFAVVQYLALIPSTLNCQSRVFWGFVMSLVIIALLIMTLGLKYNFAPGQDQLDKWNTNIRLPDGSKDKKDSLEAKRSYQSWGYILVESSGKLQLDMTQSLYFEIIALIFQFLASIYFCVMHFRQQTLMKSKTLGVFLYHWNLVSTTDQFIKEEEMDSDDDLKNINIGTRTKSGKFLKNKEEKQKKELQKAVKEKYRQFMDKKMKNYPRCYIDCYYFSKRNKFFFMMTFMFQMLQSMGFNCLIELPQLFMMLAFASFFAFRNKAFIAYSFYILFFVTYCAISVFVKLTYSILIHTTSYREWYEQNNDTTTVKILSATFGQRINLDAGAQGKTQEKMAYKIAIGCCFIFSHSWLAAKWSTVREQTSFLQHGTSWLKRWHFAHAYKNQVFTQKQSSEQVIKNIRKDNKKKKKKEAGQDDQNEINDLLSNVGKLNFKDISKTDFLSTMKTDYNYYMPSINIWFLRFGFGAQAYLYHSTIGLFHLTYVLSTFFFSRKFTYFMSITVVLPIYALEFITVYGIGIPGFDGHDFFKAFAYFTPVGKNQMKKPMLEQTLYFFNLTMLFLAISCFRLLYLLQNQNHQKNKRLGKVDKKTGDTEDGPDTLVSFLKNKIEHEDSTFWKSSFYVLKYIHIIMLAILFIIGSQDMNHLRALGLMILFSFWTLSEYHYRKTVKLLIPFMSYFILGTYYFSLTYRSYINDNFKMYQLSFLNMYEKDKLNQWKEGDSIYFRFKPYKYDWIILILTSALVSVNQIFRDKVVTENMSEICYNYLEQKHQQIVFLFIYVSYSLRGYMVGVLMMIQLYCVGRAQTNMINIIFFSVSVINLMVIARADNKVSTIKRSLLFSKIMLYVSTLVILMEFTFACTFGLRETPQFPQSFDQQFKAKNKWTYNHFQLIGFRMLEDRDELPYPDQSYKDYLKLKFISLVFYQLISGFCITYLQDRKEKIAQRLEKDESEWKKYFEYRYPEGFKKDKKKKQDLNSSIMTSSFFKRSLSQYSMGNSQIMNSPSADENEGEQNYLTQHLLRQWVAIQDEKFYTAYKWLDWWPIFDTIATYSHLLSNMIFIYIAIYYKVTVYSLILITQVCLFYVKVTYKINKRSIEIFEESGLLQQTELKIAGLISKKFAQKTYREFIAIRASFWNWQSIILITFASVGFSTTLIYRYRDYLEDDQMVLQASQNDDRSKIQGQIEKTDQLQFWTFIFGLYKDHRKEQQNYFYYPFFAVAIGLIVEKQAINWLQNRNGCTFQVFQKIIEMEQRVKAIEQELEAPPYDPNRYKNHYFYPDFELLKKKMTADSQEYKQLYDEAKQEMSENLSFIPYKVAVRLKEAIVFTLKLDSRSKDLLNGAEYDVSTLNMLNEYDKFLKYHGKFVPFSEFTHDYESFPVLKNHKTRLLEIMLKYFIERKYKISFMKGMMFAMEQFVLLITIITMILKANVFSFFYLIFIIKYFFSHNKVFLLVRMNFYIAIFFVIQYALFLLNLTSSTAPQPFPLKMEYYPHMYNNENINDLPFMIPFFYQYPSFRDLNLCYFLGIGVADHQCESLILDFINLAMISMYVFNFRNPLLFRSMKKVFWSYPNEFDSIQKWKRLEPDVIKQHKWFKKPYNLKHEKYQNIQLDDKEVGKMKKQIQFVFDYHNMHTREIDFNNVIEDQAGVIFADKQKENMSYSDGAYNPDTGSNEANLNYMLINWLELKYDQVWSNDLMREKKLELKEQSFYFRVVKQGSILVYLTFHVFLIFVILMIATVRRSLISFIYVLILLPRMKDGAEVLNQRDFNQGRKRQTAQIRLLALRQQLKQLEDKSELKDSDDVQSSTYMAEMSNIKFQIREAEKQVNSLEKTKSIKTSEQRNAERGQESRSQWRMITVVEYWLLGFATLDMILQLCIQMPFFYNYQFERYIGIRKVWLHPLADASKQDKFNFNYAINKGNKHLFAGLVFNQSNCYMQIAIATMVTLISFQAEIFDSEGYKKYVTQTDGSMDLLLNLSKLKQKSMTYVYNNFKIQKILRNQQKREVILNTVEKLKEKLIRWRRFQSTTLHSYVPTFTSKKTPSIPVYDKDTKTDKVQKPQIEKSPKKDNSSDDDCVVSDEPEASIPKQKIKDTEKDIFSQPEEKSEDESPKKKKRVVMITVQSEDDVIEDEEDDQGEEHLLQIVNEKKHKSIPEDKANELFDSLAMEFVKQKKERLGKCARCYLCLQKRYVNQILIKNEKDQLDQIVDAQSRGKSMDVLCELEEVMYNEVKDIIRNKYDNLEGTTELWTLLNSSRGKSGKSLLQLTQLDKKIKLTQMHNTWEFTRMNSLLPKYVETFFYILISNTDNIIYLSMMASMYQTAGIVSFIYPILIFGYALLEETRPKQVFWNYIRAYTLVMLSIKFTFNLKMFDYWTEGALFKEINGLMQIGLHKKNSSFSQIIIYLVPEIMILIFIMLNQMKLRLLGLNEQFEEDFESVNDAVKRYIYQGDTTKVLDDKIKRTHMDMAKYFISYETMVEDEKEMKKQEKLDKLEQDNSFFNEAKFEDDKLYEEREPTQVEKQESLLQGYSEQIHLGSTDFDIDETGDITSPLDVLVNRKMIKKGLENDSLYFMEGGLLLEDEQFVDAKDFKLELIEKYIEEKQLSSGDFEQEVEEIQEILDFHTEEQYDGLFERSSYLKRIFPSSMEQKPGLDFYGTTTLILMLLAIFVMMYFDKLFVTPEDLLTDIKGSSDIFSGKLSLILLTIMFVVILERYISRADVRIKIKQKGLKMEETSFFNKQQMFNRSATERSMTIKLKTMKTSEIDMTGEESQGFLAAMAQEQDRQGPQQNQTKVSKQQKYKFFLHWTILIVSHIFIFFYIPTVGNIELYGVEFGSLCDDDNKEQFKYGCRNFHSKWHSAIFYSIICLYLYVSAKQIRYGFPTFKIASSVLRHYTWWSGPAAIIYMAIPFAAELRCLFDFSFTKTSLDIFQFWQLFNYHVELFCAKQGNFSYADKIFGAEVTGEDYLIGYLVLGLLLFLLIGPIVLFSDYALTVTNPIDTAEISVALVVSKNLTKQNLIDRSVWKWEKEKKLRESLQHLKPSSQISTDLQNDQIDLHESPYKNAHIREAGEDIDFDIIFGRKKASIDHLLKNQSPSSPIAEMQDASINLEEKSSTRLTTSVPFVLYKVGDPNMRNITDQVRKNQKYNNWTETKAFHSDQIQQVICTEYPDRAWTIDHYNKEFLMQDINNTFIKQFDGKQGFNISLLVETKFTRKLPTGAKTATGKQVMNLNISRMNDCQTMQQLQAFTAIDCQNNETASAKILFQQAYQPHLVLGATTDVFPLIRNISNVGEMDQALNERNQMYDILLEYRCPDIWLVRASKSNTTVTTPMLEQMIVQDPSKGCVARNWIADTEEEEQNRVKLPKGTIEKSKDVTGYQRFYFILFSMVVSGSFLSGYSVKTFYFGLVYGLSSIVRVAFVFGTWQGFIYEITEPMPIIKIFEAVYMYRFEQDLYKEEECYRMIQEIIRSPDLLKALTGSSLKGSIHPMLDKFDEEDKLKYRHLEKLEARKKFDVKELKSKIENQEKYREND